jgi:indole-3-glycerol phosphate synthase
MPASRAPGFILLGLTPMAVTLSDILAATRQRVDSARRAADLRDLERKAESHTPRGFRRSLERKAQSGLAVIAELKKASPSRGRIRGTLHVGGIARDLQGAGAAALSVLTEEQFFHGGLWDLAEASAATELPCLRKDFIVDEFQLLEARANGADAVLLILSALDDSEFQRFYRRSRELGLDALCEVHDERELQRALAMGAEVVGVNNRDLRTFQVDLRTAERLAPKLPARVLRVAESGIQSGDDIRRLRACGYDAFLVGESLMRSDDPGARLAAMLSEAMDVSPGVKRLT